MANAKRKEVEPAQPPRLEIVDSSSTQDEKDQARFIKGLSEGALECRATRNHHWTGWGILYRIDRWNVGQAVECRRCGMRKVVILERGRRGAVTTRYFPPEGYSRKAKDTPDGSTALSPLAVQEELMRRAAQMGTNDEVRAVWNAYRNKR